MKQKRKNALVLCTGNSARSILAEAILNKNGNGRIRAWSAGSNPTGEPKLHALRLLQGKGYDTTFARSKSWDEFTLTGAPEMDYIFTVCDNAAAETCPVWPGHPATIHWGIPDPAAITGSDDEVMAAYVKAYERLESRIGRFLELPFETMQRSEVKQAIEGGTASAA